MEKINIFEYITFNDPDKARSFLLLNGYEDVPKNYGEVSRLLADYVDRHQEEGLKKLLSIHPEVINDILKVKNATGVKEENGQFLNCQACIAKMSADATAPANAAKPEKAISEKVTNALIIGGSVVLASVMIALIVATAIRPKS